MATSNSADEEESSSYFELDSTIGYLNPPLNHQNNRDQEATSSLEKESHSLDDDHGFAYKIPSFPFGPAPSERNSWNYELLRRHPFVGIDLSDEYKSRLPPKIKQELDRQNKEARNQQIKMWTSSIFFLLLYIIFFAKYMLPEILQKLSQRHP